MIWFRDWSSWIRQNSAGLISCWFLNSSEFSYDGDEVLQPGYESLSN